MMYKLVRTAGDSQTGNGAPAREPSWRRSELRLDDSLRLAVFEAGLSSARAPAIVLVHGLGHWTQAAWNHLAAALEGTHRIIAFDLPGFGESSKPDARYDLRFFSATLRNVIAAAGIKRYALAGHSLGGLIAGDYAAMFPEEVRLLVLIDPAGFLRTPKLLLRIVASKPVSGLLTIKPTRGFVDSQMLRSVYDPASLSAEVMNRAYELALDPDLRRAFARVYSGALQTFLDMPGLHRKLGSYRGPAVLVWGRNDRYIPVRALATARLVYPHAEVTVIDECGHCPPIEYPNILADRLRQFNDPGAP